MTRGVRAFVAVLVLLAASAASGAPFTSSFDALRDELAMRRDSNYAGTLTGAQRRELAALEACLERIDGTHASIADDAKSLKFVAKKLLRGFKAEFAGDAPGSLPGLLAGATVALLGAAESEYGTLQAAIDTAVDPVHREQASELAASARAALDEAALPTTPPTAAAALVVRAMKRIVQAIDLANYRPPTGVRAKLGGRWFTPATVTPVLHVQGTTVTVQFSAEGTHPVTDQTERLVLAISGEVGEPIDIDAVAFPFVNSCVYQPDGSQETMYRSRTVAGSDAVITYFDAATGSVAGRFSVDLVRDETQFLAIRKGTFAFTGLAVGKSVR